MMTEINNSNLWAMKDLASMTDVQDQELKRRLSLYEVFVKLYEKHSTLLDEILQLENQHQPSLNLMKRHYIQGVVDGSSVYVITNLGEKQTQTLRQPQQIWIIGRDRSSGICIEDHYLSRRHAAIQYTENQGFCLIDFKSTNGSFVNGQRIYQSLKLKDGDRIRLGNMTFDFYLSHSSCVLPTVAMELLMQLTPRLGGSMDETIDLVSKIQKPRSENTKKTAQVSQDTNFIQNLGNSHGNLNAQQQSEILDRFLNSSKPYKTNP